MGPPLRCWAGLCCSRWPRTGTCTEGGAYCGRGGYGRPPDPGPDHLSYNERRPCRCHVDFLAGPITSDPPVTRHCHLSLLWSNQGPVVTPAFPCPVFPFEPTQPHLPVCPLWTDCFQRTFYMTAPLRVTEWWSGTPPATNFTSQLG